ncbi:Beta-catenin [Fasciola hepatica]|uniref:Beta-catenin n=1 Tax=Fasciola hepatica TaxID=6192 RepID=A0A4E0QZL0_FASHE|nr:Beta-catenin [Fasciola hepatica]
MDSEAAQKMGDVPSVAPAECKVSSSQPLEKCQDVKLWQQSHYMADSGIHSALGTHTPSLSGKLGVDEVESDDHYQRGCSFNQWPSFPLSANPGDSSLLSPATPSTGSVMGVDNLGDTPGGSHSTSNVDLRGNKLPDIDTDEAASAIPDLVKLIKDEDDQVIIYQSSMMVFQLSKSEAIDALIRSNEMIECIISALDRTDDPETVRLLSGTLYNMSQTQTGLKLLDCGDSSMVTCAAGILSNLTCNNHTNKFIVHKLGGIQALLRAVGQVGAKEDILEPCMCALRHLTSRHEDEETARHIIVHELAGLPVVARILHAATAGICQELGLVCQPPQSPVTSWMLIKAMVGLLRNLSVNLDSHSGMREYGLVTGLFLLLYATQHEIIKDVALGVLS